LKQQPSVVDVSFRFVRGADPLPDGRYSLFWTEPVAGAQHEPARAAVLALILLAFTLAAFALQMRLLAGTSFVTVSGNASCKSSCVR
jgi:hypothetical protein